MFSERYRSNQIVYDLAGGPTWDFRIKDIIDTVSAKTMCWRRERKPAV